MIAQELTQALAPAARDRSLSDVRIGLGYTAVMLDDGTVGVAYTFRRDARNGCSVFTGRRPLAGRSAVEILGYLGSSDRIECAVGLAVANALANRPSQDQQEGDILTLLKPRAEDRVGMVGYFGPLVAPLEQQVQELLIFERDASRSTRVLPAGEAYRLLPQCDVALVGASTPLAADVFRALGVTLLSGVTVIDGPGVLQIVSEGGGMGFFGERVRKVNLRLTR